MNRRPKRSRAIRWILGLMAAAVAVYGVASLLTALLSPVKTVEATAYSAGHAVTTTGWMIREEQALYADDALVTPALAEGEKAGYGQVVAYSYDSAAALAATAATERMTERLQLLSSPASPPDEAVRALAQAAQSGDLAAADAAGIQLRSALSGDTTELQQAFSDVQAQLEALAGAGIAEALTAPAAGYFSCVADGLETVLTPQTLDTLTAETLAAMPEAEAPEGAYGRLITSETWYLAAVARTGLLEEGDAVQVVVNETAVGEMSVVRAGEDGLVILCSDEKVYAVSALRRAEVRLTFDVCEGLLIPAQAVRYDETGQPGVYVLEAGCAKWKAITILQLDGESCVAAQDASGTEALWPGDKVLLTEQELYDGKVVG